jgi:hypothetical protein
MGPLATQKRRSPGLLRTVFPAPLEEIDAELLSTGHWEGELVHTKADGAQVVVATRWSLRRDEQQQPFAILELNTISPRANGPKRSCSRPCRRSLPTWRG